MSLADNRETENAATYGQNGDGLSGVEDFAKEQCGQQCHVQGGRPPCNGIDMRQITVRIGACQHGIVGHMQDDGCDQIWPRCSVGQGQDNNQGQGHHAAHAKNDSH